MGLHLADGGHLTHGFQTATKKVSASSLYFQSEQYHVDPNTGIIDYDTLEKRAMEFGPKIIIAGKFYTRAVSKKNSARKGFLQ